jgi:hypothetical protein
MQRRMFLTALGATMTTPAYEWLIAEAATDTARSGGSGLPASVIDELDLITAGLRRTDDQLGGNNLRSLVGVHLRTVVDLLENRWYSASTGRRLHTTAAELARLGGFLAFDAGCHPQAQRYWVAALHSAHAAGDRGLGANVLGFMSCQAKDLGQTREAVTLAETARAGYPATAPRVQAILDLRAAEAYAVDGDLTRTRRAVDSAFDRFSDPVPGHGEPDWAYWLDITHAHGQAGYCYLRLGQWARARTHLRAALAAQGSTTSREGALRQVLMATAYVRQDRPRPGRRRRQPRDRHPDRPGLLGPGRRTPHPTDPAPGAVPSDPGREGPPRPHPRPAAGPGLTEAWASAPTDSPARRQRSGDVEAVEVHHLVPGGDEVAHELRLGVRARVHLGERPQLGV